MPSPFPGMDPYLENSARWPGVQQGMITYIASMLNATLLHHYVADIRERIYVVLGGQTIYPDISLPKLPFESRPPSQSSIGIAAAASDRPWVITPKPEEIREVYIEILSVRDETRVIATIEVLSPSNKAADSDGRRLYLTKQQELLSSQTHLIEIDLLRSGEHTVAVPRGLLAGYGEWDYLVCLHRGVQKEECYEVWGITLKQRLPRIHIPLEPGDPEVVLDLQSVFNQCYDTGAYARRVNYRNEPSTAMKEADVQWADGLLREKKRRS